MRAGSKRPFRLTKSLPRPEKQEKSHQIASVPAEATDGGKFNPAVAEQNFVSALAELLVSDVTRPKSRLRLRSRARRS